MWLLAVATVALALGPCGAGATSALNSCTVNFTGGVRLPFPMCNVSLPLATRLAGMLKFCRVHHTSRPATCLWLWRLRPTNTRPVRMNGGSWACCVGCGRQVHAVGSKLNIALPAAMHSWGRWTSLYSSAVVCTLNSWAAPDLVSRLTPEEKCSALDTSNPAIGRLGIPHLPSGEGLHGVVTGCVSPAAPNSTGCPTSFPSPIGLGATFDKDLYRAVGSVVGLESRAIDNANGGSGLVMYAPNVK